MRTSVSGLDELYQKFDGVALATYVWTGDVSATKIAETAISVFETQEHALNAVIYKMFDLGRTVADS